ncbi:MAG TPA: hypothetical protein VGD68_14115, partial [Streptosporangiaceae bacterium]
MCSNYLHEDDRTRGRSRFRTALGDHLPHRAGEEAAMNIMREVERKLAAAALARDPELGRLYET